MPVRSHPSLVQVAGKHIAPDDLGDGPEKILPNDSIMLWLDTEGGMFVTDTLDDRENRRKVINMSGICVDPAGKGLSLVSSL